MPREVDGVDPLLVELLLQRVLAADYVADDGRVNAMKCVSAFAHDQESTFEARGR